MSDYISREEAIMAVTRAKLPDTTPDGVPIANGKRSVTDCVRRIKDIPAADVRPVPEGGMGEMSDGYHTFNGLYYQRMVLFAALVNDHQDKAWKSWKHEDGEPCFDGGWFIVGIDTPKGSYTYHYEDKYWNWFECKELPVAKPWDGHTEKDVTRLLSLDVRPVVRGKWAKAPCHETDEAYTYICPFCRWYMIAIEPMNYCPNCGAMLTEHCFNTAGEPPQQV